MSTVFTLAAFHSIQLLIGIGIIIVVLFVLSIIFEALDHSFVSIYLLVADMSIITSTLMFGRFTLLTVSRIL